MEENSDVDMGSEESDYQESDSASSPATSQSTTPNQQLVLINGQLTIRSEQEEDKKKKKFPCPWIGCLKSYTKPVRLEEHLRSHTNERPFCCAKCPATYRRETHLTAHMRMHLPESDRPLVCGWEGSQDGNKTTCQRRFWTQQHLRIHRENVHEGKKGQEKLKCHVCSMEFLKHRVLRSHIIQQHCPQDAPKPYVCPVPTCTLSFSHPSRLKKHERTHDPFRYTCVHQDCLNNPSVSIHQRSFTSWTDLQRHTRDAHPFNCPEASCSRNKKPFKTIRSLKQHMQSYHPPEGEEGDIPTSKIVATSRNSGSFVCSEYPPCQRMYKSARALQRHVNINHLTHRHTSCPYEGCSFSSAFPSGITRHIKSKHPIHHQTLQTNDDQMIIVVDNNKAPPPPQTFSSSSTTTQNINQPTKLTRVQKIFCQIDLLTGIGYSSFDQQQQQQLVHLDQTISRSNPRKFACPFHDLQPQLNLPTSTINQPDSSSPDVGSGNNNVNHQVCQLRFNRLYDIQRHLTSFHHLNVDRPLLKSFYGIPP